MRTTIENTENSQYNLALGGAKVNSSSKGEKTLTRSCFYEYGTIRKATFSGYSRQKSCGYAASLFSNH